jgi:hypothetical protein
MAGGGIAAYEEEQAACAGGACAGEGPCVEGRIRCGALASGGSATCGAWEGAS